VAPAAALADRRGWNGMLQRGGPSGPVEEELGLGWPLVYIPLDRYNWPTRVTRQCPRLHRTTRARSHWLGTRLEWGEGRSVSKAGPG
jgi:hypothetical protein